MGRRNIVIQPPKVRHALRERVLRQHRVPPLRLDDVVHRPWRLGPRAAPLAERAVQLAPEYFGRAGADAALAWLFARFPDLGGEGEGMAAHYVRLRCDAYYEAWCAWCLRLGVRL
jgi:hypothetical protein